jgi:cephalosporin-C deacetylase
MTWFDLPLGDLERYRPERREPPEFDEFWASTLEDARRNPVDLHLEPVDTGLALLDVADATFPGFGGQPIRAWFMRPRARAGPLPVVVQFVAYGGGRGLPYDWLLWPVAGYATLVMDTRGQGSAWSPGATPDRWDGGGEPQYPGFVTRGIGDPAGYYYRRLYTDAVRAVEAARSHPDVDPARTIVAGVSQGGGTAQAVAGLVPDIGAALIDVPFMCNVERAIGITDELPYAELARYLAVHRDKVDEALRTVSFVEGMNFGARAKAPALYSVGLTDQITPPSTVFAAYNHYAGPKEIRVWPYSGHEAGELQHTVEQLAFLSRLGLAPG